MMKVGDAYGEGKFGLSFELYPPKSSKSEAELFTHLEELVRFRPSFITCTYGAGGSTRDKTLDVVTQVHQRFGVSVAAHLTCVGSTLEQLRGFLAEAHQRGVENIVALRGDPPLGETEFRPVEGGLHYANELVALIRAEYPDFGVAVAGYPEIHQEAPDGPSDLKNLQRKVSAGGDVVITQLFYDNEDFFTFRRDCERLGVDVPIVPGILPVTSGSQIKRIASLCGARLPEAFLNDLESAGEDPRQQFEVGVRHATAQVQELIDGGVPGIHFYVLNKSQATARVLEAVDRPLS
jgi:methylenetetrahydrofolate reductase (NADPH)